jgi:ssDNA-binding replication factor A large subunit
MDDIEWLINAIISKNPEASREHILKRLEDERKRLGGLVSDDVLLRMIAAEYGVEISSATSIPSLEIGCLVPGLNDVSVAGRVIALYPSRGRSRFAGLLIADKSGVLRVILRDDKADFVNSGKVKVGQVVRFLHGYTREGRHGQLELHLGEKGAVEIIEGEETKGYPQITEIATKIGEVNEAFKNRRVNVVGRVKGEIRETAFERKNGKSGRTIRFTLTDDTGEIPVVVWNEKVDEAKKLLKNGVRLQLVNAKVKKALGGGVEIHVDAETYIDLLTLPSEKFWKIIELKDGMKNISVQGIVITKPLRRMVKTARGETVNLTVFEIRDETGSIWVSAWRKNAEKTANLKVGEKITIKNADVKKGFADQLEITTRRATTIEIIS